MPHVVVFNLAPSDRSPNNLEKIEDAISEAFVEIDEIGVNPKNISFTFVDDSTIDSETIPISIIVKLLFDKPGRTDEARQRLAEKIGKNFFQSIENWRQIMPPKILVAVERFDFDKDGFWSSEQ